jgi:hypothetical protein
VSSTATTSPADIVQTDDRPTPARDVRFANRLLARLVQQFGHHAEVKDEIVAWASSHKRSEESSLNEETINAAYQLAPSEINFGQLERDSDQLSAKLDAVFEFASAETPGLYQETLTAFRDDLRTAHEDARDQLRERRENARQWQSPPETIGGWERAIHQSAVLTYRGRYREKRAEILIERESESWFADVHEYPARGESSDRLRGIAVAEDTPGEALQKALNWMKSHS